jgi:hypothetical protein
MAARVRNDAPAEVLAASRQLLTNRSRHWRPVPLARDQRL